MINWFLNRFFAFFYAQTEENMRQEGLLWGDVIPGQEKKGMKLQYMGQIESRIRSEEETSCQDSLSVVCALVFLFLIPGSNKAEASGSLCLRNSTDSMLRKKEKL